MKHTFFLILFSCVFGKLNATHARAGEIHFRLIGNYQIEATVTTYTKWSAPSNLADRDTITISWGDVAVSRLVRLNGSDVNPQNGVPDGVFVSSDVKKSVYTGIHTYAGGAPGNLYILSVFEQNRMESILNISNSVNTSLYVEDSLFFDNLSIAGFNSSPMFLNPPADYSSLLDTLRYNPVAYDADGDSLDFELITPLQNQNSEVPLYVFPDQFCVANSFPASVLEIDRHSGEIVWKIPCQQGIFSVGFVVREYRCGLLLSTVMRDMQFIVLNEPNEPPRISYVHDTIINPGERIEFDVTASDPNAGQIATLRVLSGAYLFPSDTPVFQTTSGNPATASLSWQPNASQSHKDAYIFSFIASDDYEVNFQKANLHDYASFRVWVRDTTACVISAVEEIENKALSIYPNPAKSYISIHTSEPNETIRITNLLGEVLFGEKIIGGRKEIDVSHLPSGMYFVNSKKFVKE